MNTSKRMPGCTACGKVARLVKRKVVTGNNDDNEWVWVCVDYPGCDMYVGCHIGTSIPLGTLAGRTLRLLKL